LALFFGLSVQYVTGMPPRDPSKSKGFHRGERNQLSPRMWSTTNGLITGAIPDSLLNSLTAAD